MFQADLFIILKTWKQPRYTSIGKCMNKLWYSHIMKYYNLEIKKEISYQTTNQYGGALNVYFSVKVIGLKMRHTI